MKFIGSKSNNAILISLILFVVAIGIGFRLFQIGEQSFWLDEAYTYRYASGSLTDILSGKNDPNMILFYVIAHGWVQLFPNGTEGTWRILSAIFSIASLPVIFILGQKLFEERSKAIIAGLLATFLLSINAFNIQYAQEFRGYSLTTLLTMLSTLFFINANLEDKPKTKWWFWYILCSAGAVYSHYYSSLVLLAQWTTLPFLLKTKVNKKHDYKGLLVTILLLFLLSLPAVWLILQTGSGQIGWISKPTLLGTVGDLAFEMTGKYIRWPTFFLYFIFVGLGLGQLATSLKRENFEMRWKYLLCASCLLMPVIVSYVFSILIFPIFVDRYLLYVTPYLILLTAGGIIVFFSSNSVLPRFTLVYRIFKVVVLGAFLFLNIKNVQSYYSLFKKSDWRSATNFLTQECTDNPILFYPAYVENPVYFYNPELSNSEVTVWEEILEGDPNENQIEVALPESTEKVCLVWGNVVKPLRDQADMIAETIAEKYQLKSTTSFFDVEIEVYNTHQ